MRTLAIASASDTTSGAMADSIASFAACVDKLSTALESLKRFESTFTPDAKKTFEVRQTS